MPYRVERHPKNYINYRGSSYNNWTSAIKTVYHFANTVKGALEEVASVVLPDGTSLVSSVDYATGKALSSSDGADNYSTYTYTDNGQIETVTRPNGTTTTYVYAENGIDLLRMETGLGSREYTYNNYHQITSSTDILGNTTSYEYNQEGQPNRVTDPMGTDTIYTYNSDHQLIETHKSGQLLSTISHDTLGRVMTSTNTSGLTTSYSYNAFNHVTSVSYPDSKTTTIEYGSDAGPHLVTKTVDRSGKTVTSIFDAKKRLIRSVNHEGGVSEYVYDLNSNRVQFIDPRGNSTNFTYNRLNQLTAKTYADGTSVSFSYNDQGKLRKRMNARGIVTNYYYDEMGKLTSNTHSDSTPEVTTTYDNYSRPLVISDGSGNYTLAYDAASQLLSIDGPLENDTITYSYDVMGRKTGVSIEKGRNHTYTYDPLSRLTAIQSGEEEFSYNYVDAKSFLLQSLTRPNNSTTSYSYDGMRRLLSVTNLNSAAEILSKYEYTYNNQDLRDSEEITGGLPITNFEEGMCGSEFNIVNQLLNLNNEAGQDHLFTYDADGNMITGFTPEDFPFTAKYDAENRLAVIEFTDTEAVAHKQFFTYRWDGFLAKIEEYEGDTLIATTHIIRDDRLTLQDHDEANNILREYTWGKSMGGGIGGLFNLHQQEVSYTYLYDGKGNVIGILDGSENMVASYAYNAFGRAMNVSGTLEQPFQFSTKRYDSETGLNYYGYRFYNPKIERWMNRDPLGEKGGINLYGFVAGRVMESCDMVTICTPGGTGTT